MILVPPVLALPIAAHRSCTATRLASVFANFGVDYWASHRPYPPKPPNGSVSARPLDRGIILYVVSYCQRCQPPTMDLFDSPMAGMLRTLLVATLTPWTPASIPILRAPPT